MFSPESVQALPEPVVVVPSTALQPSSAFANEAVNRLVTLCRDTSVSPWPVVQPNELIDLVAQTGMKQDFEAAEVYVLAKMSNRLNRLHMPRDYVRARQVVTERLHTLLERRPELLHENLKWEKPTNDGECPLLRLLVLEGATLDPKRLQAMAARTDFAGEVLRVALNHGKVVGAPLFESALDRPMGCVSTALAIALADSEPQVVDQKAIENLRLRAAAGCIGRQFQYEAVISLLKILREQQVAAGGEDNGVDIGFPKWWTQPPFDWAAARNGHPVTGLLYDVNVLSAMPDSHWSEELPHFPGPQFEEATSALNALLQPHQRLRLESIAGLDLFKLMTLAPVAAENGSLPGFWASGRSEKTEHTPRAILNWVFERAASQGVPIPLDFVRDEKKLKQLFGTQHGSIEAKAAEVHMRHELSQKLGSSVPDSGSTEFGPASRPRRRAQV